MSKAEKKLTGFSFFNKAGKIGEAADLYAKAGNSYRSVRDFAKAGEAYQKAAECFTRLDSLNEAASAQADAAKMFAKTPETIPAAIEAFRVAARIYQENSKVTNAARLLVEAGKLFQENGDLGAAIEAFSSAAQLYDDENQPMQAINITTDIAEIHSQMKNWLEAGKLYREVAMRRLKDKITQLSAGEPATRAIVCQLAGDDTVAARRTMNDFLAENPGWNRSREYEMLDQVINAVNERDSQGFSTALANYDDYKRLDNWMTDALMVVKDQLDGEVDIT